LEQQQRDSVEYPEVYLVDWEQSQGGAYPQLHSETNQNCTTKTAKKCDHAWEEVILSPIHFVPTPGSDPNGDRCCFPKQFAPESEDEGRKNTSIQSSAQAQMGAGKTNTSLGIEPNSSQPLSTPDSGCGLDVGMSTVLLGELRSPMTATTCAYINTKDSDGYRWTIPMVNPPLEEQEDLTKKATSSQVTRDQCHRIQLERTRG